MKTLFTILLLALIVSAKAQTTLNLQDITSSKTWIGTSAIDTGKTGWSTYTGHSPNVLAITPPKPAYWMIITPDPKPAMKIAPIDSAGVVKVWIDPKQIKWTSDSTFVIQVKK